MTAPAAPAPENARTLGPNGPRVAGVALGCWPIAGVTTLGATDADSIATIHRALDLGVNHLDTAFAYGAEGESERLIGRALADRRAEAVVATKGGIRLEGSEFIQDARPETLASQCDESLRRMGTDHVDLLYLHSPDPRVPVEESAGGLARLLERGKTRGVGASNCTLEQLQAFASACPLAAVQLPYNMLQRDIEQRTLPWCRERGIAVLVYWPLMKGLLAGRLRREEDLAPDDPRRRYPMYQGDEWLKNQRLLDRLAEVAHQAGRTVAQVVVNWTLHQPGVTAALCGAKRPWQIEETAGALGWRLSADQARLIDEALAERGKAEAKRSFT